MADTGELLAHPIESLRKAISPTSRKRSAAGKKGAKARARNQRAHAGRVSARKAATKRAARGRSRAKR